MTSGQVGKSLLEQHCSMSSMAEESLASGLRNTVHCRVGAPSKEPARQPESREYGNAPHHVKSNCDVIVGDHSQRNAGLLQILIMAATVYSEELVDFIEVLLQLSEHIHYQVLFPNRQRGHVGTFHLHSATHTSALKSIFTQCAHLLQSVRMYQYAWDQFLQVH